MTLAEQNGAEATRMEAEDVAKKPKAKPKRKAVPTPQTKDAEPPVASVPKAAVVGADGAPLKRCVGKRKALPRVEAPPTEPIPTESETPPPRPPKESPQSDSKVPKTKAKGRGSKTSEPEAQSLEKAFAQCEEEGPKKVVKKLKLVKSKASKKAETTSSEKPPGPAEPAAEPAAEGETESSKPRQVKRAKGAKESKASKKKAETAEEPAGPEKLTETVAADCEIVSSKPRRLKAKVKEGTSQVPIRRLLLESGGSSKDADKVTHVEPSTRPKWKRKLLRIGKGGKRLDVDGATSTAEDKNESKTQTLEACFAGGGKRKAEAPEAVEPKAKAKKGLLRLGFQRKEEQKEADTAGEDRNASTEEISHLEGAVEVVDLEAKAKPRFNWKMGFAKLTEPLPPGACEANDLQPSGEMQAPEVSPESSPKGSASKLSKQGSKRDLAAAAAALSASNKVDWCERHAPTTFKHLKPPKAWQDLRDWLKSWRPRRTGKEAALVVGACGSGKTAGVRHVVRKWRGQFMEYDLADVQGRSFMENLAKKQRNGNQLSGEAMEQVLICNIAEQLTPAMKDSLALAVQASPGPVIFTAAEGVLGPKDAVHKMCLEIRISLSESVVAKQIHEISQKEKSELPLELCHTVANACPRDLRKALQVAQLLSVLSGSGQACLPQAACAPLTACERLLRHEELVIEDAISLLELDDEVPTLLRWNLLRSLSFTWCARRSAEELETLAASVQLTKPATQEPAEAGEDEQEKMDVEGEAAVQTAETENTAVPAEEEPAEAGEDGQEKMDVEEEAAVQTAETEETAAQAEEEAPEAAGESKEEKMDVEEEAAVQTEETNDTTPAEEEPMEAAGEAEQEKVDEAEAAAEEDPAPEQEAVPNEEPELEDEVTVLEAKIVTKEVPQQELDDLETCARICSLLALSDVAGYLALQAAEQAGPTSQDLGSTAEPLLLAVVSHEAQSFAKTSGVVSESTSRKKQPFQPIKALQDPVCPITMDQVAVLAMQLNVPKAWVLDRIYDWIVASRNGASQRHLKNFRNWLKRQLCQQQRQGRQQSSAALGELTSTQPCLEEGDDKTLEADETMEEGANTAEVETAVALEGSPEPSPEVPGDA